MTGSARIEVAAGVLRDRTGRVLLAERHGDAPFGGLWEFPGGKVDAGERPEQALCRELHEELAIDVRGGRHLLTVDHDYADRRVRLHFFLVADWRNEIRAVTGQRLRWVPIKALDERELLPADGPLIAVLQGLSPEPSEG